MGRQQRVSVCGRRPEGVGGRGQDGGREGATPTCPSVHLVSDPARLEAPPPQELEDPQMNFRKEKKDRETCADYFYT
ncbi:hypothetical protein JOB18_026129 [Solea senegalensis]|uniref:Uncharacterized protein n=1 Tax=Solea senegalensis TaxID=28829 RepID=A0AAV6RS35_SOLSE|nr:hypothetical protein JOB18_026129 [Solea senegalensis]